MGVHYTKKRKKIEFSKIITAIGLSMWVVVNLYSMIMMAVVLDLTPLAWVLGSVDAVVAVICGHYFWKAKAENVIKLRKESGDLADGISVTAPATSE